MSEKKVLFHALERLDLIDVEALQEQVLTYLAQALGNMVGREQSATQKLGAILTKPTSATVNNTTSTISFDDFTFLETNSDSPVSISRQSRIVTYDASESFHGTCDFTSARAVIQSYYNTQSELPPTGFELGYTESGTGLFYPYIWVKSDQIEAVTDNRRFWSVSNGQETTSTVATRSDRAVQFKVQYATPSGEWLKVARIVEWSLNGSTVELQASGIVYLSLADNLVPLPSIFGTSNEAPSFYEQFNTVNDASDFSGLLSCFKAIQNELHLMRTGGANDATYGNTLTNMTRLPQLSLDGLYDRTNRLQEQVNETSATQRGSAIFVFEANENADELNFTVINNTTASSVYPRITLNGHANYARVLNKYLPPSTPLNFNTDFNPTSNIGLSNWIASASLFSVELPASLAGYELRINPVVINTYNTGDFRESYPNLSAMIISDDNTDTEFSKALSVQQASRIDENGDTISFYGVNIGIAGIDQVFTEQRIDIGIARIAVKVDVEVVEV
jgi:hypothetical protein